jgi:hypothetical protein
LQITLALFSQFYELVKKPKKISIILVSDINRIEINSNKNMLQTEDRIGTDGLMYLNILLK